MTTLAQAINATLTSVFDIICWPLQALDPIWAMVVISLVVGLLMVWIFGKISNQDAIKLIRDRIRGNLIGVRLFQNNVRVVLGLQATIMRDTLRFMTHALGPMLVLLVPLVLVVMTQLNLRFSARPLRPGEHALVKVQVRDAAVLRGRVHLEPPDGLTVDTPAVRIPSGREVAWRIRAGEPGWHSLVVQIGDESIRKELVVGNGWAAVSELRTGRSLWDILTVSRRATDPALAVHGNHRGDLPLTESGNLRLEFPLAGSVPDPVNRVRFRVQRRLGSRDIGATRLRGPRKGGKASCHLTDGGSVSYKSGVVLMNMNARATGCCCCCCMEAQEGPRVDGRSVFMVLKR